MGWGGIGLDWIGLDRIGLDWIEFDRIRLSSKVKTAKCE